MIGKNKRKQPEDSNFEREGLMKGVDNLEVLFLSQIRPKHVTKEGKGRHLKQGRVMVLFSGGHHHLSIL